MLKTNQSLSIVIALLLTLIAVGAANGNVNTAQALGSIIYTIFMLTLIVKFGLWVVRTLKKSLDKLMKF